MVDRDETIKAHFVALRNILTKSTNDRVNADNSMAEATMQDHRRIRDDLARLRERFLTHNF